MDPTRSREMPSCSAIDLAEIHSAVVEDYLVNLINNLRGGYCFGSSRTRRITGGKITTFKLGHPVLDGGVPWCMFPYVSVRIELISFGALPCRGKKNLMTARVSTLLKSRASPDMSISASETRKDLQFGT